MKQEKLLKLILVLSIIFLSLLIFNQVGLLAPLLQLIQSCSFLVLALILAFIFEPIVELIPRFSRPVRCTLVYFSLLLIIIVFLFLVIPVLVAEFSQIENALRDFLKQPFFSGLLKQVQQMDLNQGIMVAMESTVGIIKDISDFSLSYIAAYFISLDLVPLLHFVKRHIHPVEQFEYFYRTCSNVVFHYIKGLSLDLLFIMLSQSLVFWIFGVRHPFIFAMLMAFLNLIPYIGATIGQLIVLIVDMINTGQVRLELFVISFLVQQLEANFVQPYIFKKVLSIKPIVTLVSIIVFGFLFGFAGFILAPVLAVLLQLAYRSYRFANERKTVGTWENMWYNFEEILEEDK